MVKNLSILILYLALTISAYSSSITDEQTFKKNLTYEDSLETTKTLYSFDLVLNEKDTLKAQIFTCWSVPIGLPYSEDLVVRIKLYLEPDGIIKKIEILEQPFNFSGSTNESSKEYFKTLSESVVRAIKLCNPLKVPESGYDTWKELILEFDARDMLG